MARNRFGFAEITVQLDVYDAFFTCIFGKPDKLLPFLDQRLGRANWTAPEARHRGMTYTWTGKAPVVWMPRPPRSPAEIGVLAHEIVHVLTAILVEKGLRLTESSEEAFAYAMGFCLRSVLERAQCRSS